MAEIQWFYARGGEQMGPVSPAGLRQIAQAGAIAAGDLVWREGMAEWAPAGSVKGLFPDAAKVKDAGPREASTPMPATPSKTPAADFPLAADVAKASATPPAMTPKPTAAAILGVPARSSSGTSGIGRVSQLVQLALWVLCAAIVILAACQFTVAALRAENPTERAAAAAIFSAYFVGAYVVARAGERLCTLVENWGKR